MIEWVHKVPHSTRFRFHVFKLVISIVISTYTVSKKRILEVPDQHCHLTFIIDEFITP